MDVVNTVPYVQYVAPAGLRTGLCSRRSASWRRFWRYCLSGSPFTSRSSWPSSRGASFRRHRCVGRGVFYVQAVVGCWCVLREGKWKALSQDRGVSRSREPTLDTLVFSTQYHGTSGTADPTGTLILSMLFRLEIVRSIAAPALFSRRCRP